MSTVLLMRFQQQGTDVITHHTWVHVCVLPDWPTWLVPHWPSYKYSYSHTILITAKGRVHIGGELYIIEKVIYLSTNLLISYWTRGVKKKFLEIESYSSTNLYISDSPVQDSEPFTSSCLNKHECSVGKSEYKVINHLLYCHEPSPLVVQMVMMRAVKVNKSADWVRPISQWFCPL